MTPAGIKEIWDAISDRIDFYERRDSGVPLESVVKDVMKHFVGRLLSGDDVIPESLPYFLVRGGIEYLTRAQLIGIKFDEIDTPEGDARYERATLGPALQVVPRRK
jgi:hypothetical protein